MLLSYLQKLLHKIQGEAAVNEWAKGEDRGEKKTSFAQHFFYPVETSLERDSDDVVRENTRELWRTVSDIFCNKDDLFKNGACKQDKIRPGWKSRFYREKLGAETSKEVGRLQTEMVVVSLVSSCKWSLMRLAMGNLD